MICSFCAKTDHHNCLNWVRLDGTKRDQEQTTQCDCQHKERKSSGDGSQLPILPTTECADSSNPTPNDDNDQRLSLYRGESWDRGEA